MERNRGKISDFEKTKIKVTSPIEKYSKENGGIIIDLSGPLGNAYILLGFATSWSDQIGLDTKSIIADMLSGNYFHLLDVFEKHFSCICTLTNRPKIIRNKKKR